MEFGTERNRKRWEALTPEQREAVERVRAGHQTPEYRAEEGRIAELARAEFPPLSATPQVLALAAALKAERERQGLSLTDVAGRSRLDRAFVSKLEHGKIANPTVATLRAFAKALGMELTLALRPAPVTAGQAEARTPA